MIFVCENITCITVFDSHHVKNRSVKDDGSTPYTYARLDFFTGMWAIFYYVVVLVLLRSWTKNNNKDTLYDHCMKTDARVSGFVNLFPHSLKGIAYMFTHFFTTVTFGFLSVIFWHSFVMHTLFLLCMMFIAVKNGAAFVFEYEMLRYANKLLKKHPEITEGRNVDIQKEETFSTAQQKKE